MTRIEKLTDLLQADPEDSFLQHALALEYIKTGDDAQALGLFNTILARQPDYVGSYYHLAKLLERTSNFTQAIITYEKGMAEAKKAGDQHSYNELQGALEDLEDD